MTKRKKNVGGRPSLGLTESTLLIRCPEALAERMRKRAAAEGVTVSEMWRRAAWALTLEAK